MNLIGSHGQTEDNPILKRMGNFIQNVMYNRNLIYLVTIVKPHAKKHHLVLYLSYNNGILQFLL